jgi:hypothetical protein
MTETTVDGGKRLLTAGDAMRCSTAERDRTAAAISTATGEGRLPLDEADERLELAYAARYRHELDALVADLPEPERRGGWSAVALLARAQLSEDAARLLGRSGDAATRRFRIAFLSVVAVLITAMLVLAFVHGIVDEGPEFPGGRD